MDNFILELNTTIENAINNGISITKIKKQINETITKFKLNKNTKPKKRIICRPVLYISDSSDNE